MPTATIPHHLQAAIPWLVALFGLVAIAGVSGWINAPWVGAVFKPLTTLLIILHALGSPSRHPEMRRGVLAGLGLAFLGDCAFASEATFVAGLYLFVLAQCCHLSVLLKAIGPARPGLVHVAHAAAVVWAISLWSARPNMVFVPVAIFLCLLGLMSAQAETWWLRSRGTPRAAVARCAALGGLFWLMADLLLTSSQFVLWVPGTYALVLTSYWLAQWHLASILRAPQERARAAAIPSLALHPHTDRLSEHTSRE
jgi:uncharacterized membrane protein YhhN